MKKYENAIGILSFVISCLVQMNMLLAGWYDNMNIYQTIFNSSCCIVLFTYIIIDVTLKILRKKGR